MLELQLFLGEIFTVEETSFYVEVKPGPFLSSLAAGQDRVPARGRVLTSSHEGKAEEGLSSHFSSISGIHSSRWARKLEGCFIREARALGTKKNPGVPHSQVQELSALYSGSSEQ